MTKWRTGRKNPLVLYEQIGDEPSDTDPMIGSMFSAEYAARVVEAVNAHERPVRPISDEKRQVW